MDGIRRTLVGIAISAFLLIGDARADLLGEVTEPGRLTPFTSQSEMNGTLKALIQQSPNCSALQDIVYYVTRTRPVFSPIRLDGPREMVQEGGIVKRYGDYLVVLHRNRLFTIAIGGGSLRPVGAVSALTVGDRFSPSAYDELLLLGDRVVLTGWSSDGVEIATFGIDRSGHLSRAGTWHLQATSDCFSRSYASFVVDGKLVVYSWHDLDVTDDVDALLPALRKWPEAEPDDEDEAPPFVPTASARDVFHKRLASGHEEATTLHTVTVCELPGGALKCTSSSLLGRAASEFHVAENALYLWSAGESGRYESLGGDAPQGVLYRMTYDGSSPGRVPVSGRPRDRFSFRSDRTHLEVLLTSTQQAEDHETLSMALLRVPVAEIARGRKVASSRYVPLPSIRYGLQANRFVGDQVIYSSALPMEDDSAPSSRVVFANTANGRSRAVSVPCVVTWIEAAGGSDALAGGAATDERCGLRITRLPRSSPVGSTTHFDFPQAEALRLEPFRYDSAPSAGVGVIAVPMRSSEAPDRKYLQENVSVAFLANEASGLRPMGSIVSREQDVTDDVCEGSVCWGWFNNARALFIGDRILVLMGYELIEARRSEGQLVETARIHFAPPEIISPERAMATLP